METITKEDSNLKNVKLIISQKNVLKIIHN